MKLGPPSRLGRQFLFRFLPPMLLVILGVTALTVWVEFRQAEMAMEKNGRNLLALYGISLRKPLWDVDAETISGILVALASLPSVQGVWLEDSSQNKTFTGGQPMIAGSGGIYQSDLIYSDQRGREYPLGRLGIQLRQPDLWKLTLARLQTYLPLLVAALAAAAIVAIWVNHLLVIRPLEAFRRAIESGDSDQGQALRSDHLPADELGDVMHAYLRVSAKRREVEAQLRANQERLQIVTENLPGAFLFQCAPNTDGHPVFTYASDSIERIMGIRPNDLYRDGSLLFGLVDPDYLSRLIVAQKESVAHWRDFSVELPLNMPNGERRWVRIMSRPTTDRIGQMIYSGIQVDVTELHEVQEKLQDAIALAETANLAKSAFIANMSHEIRTPMNAIIGFSENLIHTLPDPRQQQKARIIAESGANLLALVNDILDLSKIEAGRIELKPEPIYLPDFFQSIRQFFSHEAEGKGLRLQVDLASDVPGLVSLDPIRFRQILINLVGNAVKFTERGGVEISVRRGAANSDPGTCSLVVAVIDSGPGVPDEFKTQIFKNFERGLSETRNSEKGTGLGLPLATHLAKLMGGRITLEDHPAGTGCVFSLLLPEVSVPELAEQKNPVTPAAPDAADLAGLRFDAHPQILLVDDSSHNLRLLKVYFDQLGFPLLLASGGDEALRLAREHQPGLILTDIRMPGMSGRELFHVLREKADSDLARIPVVAMTASALPEMNALDEELFDGILIKPFSRVNLLRELTKFLPHHYESIASPSGDTNDHPISIDEARHLLGEMKAGLRDDILKAQSGLRMKDIETLIRRLERVGKACPAPFVLQMESELQAAALGFEITRMLRIFDRLLKEEIQWNAVASSSQEGVTTKVIPT